MSEVASGDADGNRADHSAAGPPRSSGGMGSHTPEVPASKNALRKLRRQQWLKEAKDRRRALRADAKRLKKKLKREAAASNKDPTFGEHGKDAGLTVRICVDCAFEDLQGESEIFSLVQQLMYAYGDANRLNRQRDKASGIRRRWKSGWRSKSAGPSSATDAPENCIDARGDASPSEPPVRCGESSMIQQESICNEAATAETKPSVEFCITGIGPKVKEALKREKFAEQCARGQAVYLTADADEELDTLDPATVYIVGVLRT
ncbi:hypothetical protein Emag_003012 [Eimeria magna]